MHDFRIVDKSTFTHDKVRLCKRNDDLCSDSVDKKFHSKIQLNTYYVELKITISHKSNKSLNICRLSLLDLFAKFALLYHSISFCLLKSDNCMSFL
jgi:hypothetical protein